MLGPQRCNALYADDRLKTVQAPNGASTQYQYDDLGNLLQEISPDRGTVSYAYAAAGNMTQQTDARGVVSTYAYDALNRLTCILMRLPVVGGRRSVVLGDRGVLLPARGEAHVLRRAWGRHAAPGRSRRTGAVERERPGAAPSYPLDRNTDGSLHPRHTHTGLRQLPTFPR